MLHADDLRLRYTVGGTAANALDGVSVVVPKGTFLGVIGPSGSGKSSLLYLLSGLKAPTSGTVRFEDMAYRDLGTARLIRLRRERFGFIFQQHFLVNYLTVLENALVGALRPDAAAQRRARELLDGVGLGGKLRLRPYQLSVGERQRVAVVRALLHRPSLVFADEPTAALDQATGRQVISLLVRFHQAEGGSVVVVTHDQAMLQDADQVLQLRDGRLN